MKQVNKKAHLWKAGFDKLDRVSTSVQEQYNATDDKCHPDGGQRQPEGIACLQQDKLLALLEYAVETLEIPVEAAYEALEAIYGAPADYSVQRWENRRPEKVGDPPAVWRARRRDSATGYADGPPSLTGWDALCTIEGARAKSRARVWQPGKQEAGANRRRVYRMGGFFVPAVSNAAACAWEPLGAAGLPLAPVCQPRASRLHSSGWQRMGGGVSYTSKRKQTMQHYPSGASAPPRLSVRKSNGYWLARLTFDSHSLEIPYSSLSELTSALRLWWALHAPPDPSPPDTPVSTDGRARPCIQ